MRVSRAATRLRSSTLSTAAWVAWGIVSLSVLISFGYVALFVVTLSIGDVDTPGDPLSSVGALIFGVIGGLIVMRQPRHVLGWLFVLFGFTSTLGAFLWQWGVVGLEVHPDTLPWAAAALWISFWVGLPAFTLEPTLVLLVFPSGTLQGRVTRSVGALSLFAACGLLISLMLTGFAPPESDEILANNPSPFGELDVPGFLDPGVFIIMLAACALASITILLRRLRRSSGVERQQFKWIAYAMALVVVTFIADFFARASGSPLIVVTGPAISLAFVLLPITVGIAILRFQLFDIDRVISRTLVYGGLTAGLAGAYLLGVLLLHQLLDPFTSGTDLEIAATTLLVAALARPLRNRLQALVDRRFYRRHYDAATEIDRFVRRLREQTDIDALSYDIRAIVSETMQPNHVSLWVRSSQPSRRHR